MALPTTAQVQKLIAQLTDSWSAGSGQKFGAAFTGSAHFVAFDGTVLEGPEAIARFHQSAFDRYLQNTSLEISITGKFAINQSVLLVYSKGGIQSKSGSTTTLTGDSLQMMVVVIQDGNARIQAFQNTRNRPITDEESASAWREFDRMWDRRVQPAECKQWVGFPRKTLEGEIPNQSQPRPIRNHQ